MTLDTKPQKIIETHFNRVLQYAQDICQKLYHPIIIPHEGKVHFRPTGNGITMVGLLEDRPQRGRGGYSADRLIDNFDEQFRKYCIDIEQGRNTPEKKLQSYLISNAYLNDRKMKVLVDSDSSQQLSTGNLLFITDEIRMPYKSEHKTCDILALRIEGNDTVPLIIELKPERKMKELVHQLEDYAEVMTIHQRFYENLYSALLGRKIAFTALPEKWLVWPPLKKELPMVSDRREKELAEKKIGVIQYIDDNGCFSFHVGKKPS